MGLDKKDEVTLGGGHVRRMRQKANMIDRISTLEWNMNVILFSNFLILTLFYIWFLVSKGEGILVV